MYPSLLPIMLLGTLLGARERAPTKGSEPAGLFLEPVPTITALLSADGRKAPARTRMVSEKPLRMELEAFDTGDIVELCVEQENPVVFCAAADALHDTGTFSRGPNQLTLGVDRQGTDGKAHRYEVLVNTQPQAEARPPSWLKPGSTLYYGRAYAEKPVTKVVPMALTVRLAEASDGSRVFSWTADVDPDRETDLTAVRTIQGRRIIKPEVKRSGTRHSDAFTLGDNVPEDAGSLFLSQETFAALLKYRGAPFSDVDVPDGSVLVHAGEIEIQIQADNSIWRIPAVVANLAQGQGQYVIANDPEYPLILSATRPGWQLRLMAIGSP